MGDSPLTSASLVIWPKRFAELSLLIILALALLVPTAQAQGAAELSFQKAVRMMQSAVVELTLLEQAVVLAYADSECKSGDNDACTYTADYELPESVTLPEWCGLPAGYSDSECKIEALRNTSHLLFLPSMTMTQMSPLFQNELAAFERNLFAAWQEAGYPSPESWDRLPAAIDYANVDALALYTFNFMLTALERRAELQAQLGRYAPRYDTLGGLYNMLSAQTQQMATILRTFRDSLWSRTLAINEAAHRNIPSCQKSQCWDEYRTTWVIQSRGGKTSAGNRKVEVPVYNVRLVDQSAGAESQPQQSQTQPSEQQAVSNFAKKSRPPQFRNVPVPIYVPNGRPIFIRPPGSPAVQEEETPDQQSSDDSQTVDGEQVTSEENQLSGGGLKPEPEPGPPPPIPGPKPPTPSFTDYLCDENNLGALETTAESLSFSERVLEWAEETGHAIKDAGPWGKGFGMMAFGTDALRMGKSIACKKPGSAVTIGIGSVAQYLMPRLLRCPGWWAVACIAGEVVIGKVAEELGGNLLAIVESKLQARMRNVNGGDGGRSGRY